MDGESISDWVVGVLVAVFGLVGLVMASGARDIEILIFGLSLLGFALVFIAGIVRRNFPARAAAAVKGTHHG